MTVQNIDLFPLKNGPDKPQITQSQPKFLEMKISCRAKYIHTDPIHSGDVFV